MLKLTTGDLTSLAKTGSGIKTWSIKVRGRKSLARVVAWEDLALISPQVQWPRNYHPEREEGWGNGTLRLVWVPGLQRVVARPGVPVPVLGSALELGRAGTKPLRVDLRTVRHGGVTCCALGRADGSLVYCSSKSLRRVTASMDKRLRGPGVSVRLAELESGASMVLVFLHSTVRAVLALVP